MRYFYSNDAKKAAFKLAHDYGFAVSIGKSDKNSKEHLTVIYKRNSNIRNIPHNWYGFNVFFYQINKKLG